MDAIQGAYSAIISFKKIIDDLKRVEGVNSEIRRLLIDLAEAVHEQLLANLRLQQAQLLEAAADERLATAQADLQSAEDQLSTLTTDVATVTGVALRLYAMAHQYTDHLAKYVFMSARAVEIYTLQDMGQEIYFDYGFIHPDEEERYRKNLMLLSELTSLYMASWAQFPSIIRYRDFYEDYLQSGDWVFDYYRIGITDADILNEFRTTGRLSMLLSDNSLPISREEARVVSVLVTFIGGQSTSDVISTVVQHSGRYTQRRRNGETIDFVLRPRSTICVAPVHSLGEDLPTPITDPSTLAFWGRGVTTYWQIMVEPEEITTQQIDWTNLSEIQFWIGYESFLEAHMLPAILINGRMYKTRDSSSVYTVYGITKFLIGDSSKQRRAAQIVPGKYIEAYFGIPPNGTLLREVESKEVYIINDGFRYQFKDKKGREKTAAINVSRSMIQMLPYGGKWKHKQ